MKFWFSGDDEIPAGHGAASAQERPIGAQGIEDSLRKAEKDIHDAEKTTASLKNLFGKVSGAAVALGVLTVVTKAMLFLDMTGLSLLALGAVQVARHFASRDLDRKRETHANLVVTQELARKAAEGLHHGPRHDHGLHRARANDDFAAAAKPASDAERIRDLERTVAELRDKLDDKPVELDKPKVSGASIFDRFRR